MSVNAPIAVTGDCCGADGVVTHIKRKPLSAE
jgi:hypothetical protein